MMGALIILILLQSRVVFSFGEHLFLPIIESPVYDVELKNDLIFSWQIDHDQEEIIVEIKHDISSRDDFRDWIGIGFSDYGEPQNADLCILWSDWKGKLSLEDTHTNDNNETFILEDPQQDCRDFQIEFLPNTIHFMFKRKFDTCDENDYVLQDGTTHIIWSIGSGPLYNIDNVQLSNENIATYGFVRTRLFKVDVPSEFPRDSQNLEIRHKIDLPPDDTTYWCSTHKLPNVFKRKHHAVQYEPIMAKGNEHLLHHMEVFHCVPDESDGNDAEFPIWSGPCGSESAPEKLNQCKKVLAAWAIGAGPFTYPPEAGLQIGGQDFGGLYVMLEVHFNNVEKQSGVKDYSGMRFIVTQELRPHDAGIMELGLVYTDKMAIPPNQHRFPLHGYCLPQCSAVGFPSEGINIFGSQLHTHGTGVEVETRHFRNGQELPEINRDNHYSTHFQEIRSLSNIHNVMPGDELVTTCWYSTLNKDRPVVGGFTFAEEMCVNYIHYYPRAKSLEICKSSVDGNILNDYFDFLRDFDGQNTNSKTKNVTENYNAINWTPMKSEELLDFYDEAPLEMQCQSGGGSPLPGKWTNMQKSDIDLTPQNLPRHCSKSSEEDIGLQLSDKRQVEKRGSINFSPHNPRGLKDFARLFKELRRKRISTDSTIEFRPKFDKRASRPFSSAPRNNNAKIVQNKMKKSSRPFSSAPNRSLLMVADKMKKARRPFSTAPNRSLFMVADKMKKSSRPFSSAPNRSLFMVADKMKKAGRPFNAMKRKRRPFKKGPTKRKPMIRSKKDDEIYEYDGMIENNEEDIEDNEDEDFSKYWTDYDTFGYDKRGLGSMKRRISSKMIPYNDNKFM